MPLETRGSWDLFLEAVGGLVVGKRLPAAVYVHRSLLIALPQRLRSLAFEKIEENAFRAAWSVVKFSLKRPALSLLDYPGFDEEAFPRLRRSLTIDLANDSAALRDYPQGDRAFILHRKELLVPPNYLLRDEFELITQELEAAGIFKATRSIGRLGEWRAKLASAGYELVDGRLLRSDLFVGSASWQALRGRTALSRSVPSAPVQAMHRWGWLDGANSLLDYGCGRGNDLNFLKEIGTPAWGWDPAHRSDGELRAADLVNLGYVINVIEDPDEREQVIASAFKLTRKALVVSAMIAPPAQFERFLPYRDGVVTSRGTFQKYFTQTELKELVERITGAETVGLAPGVVASFRDPFFQEAFNDARYRRRYQRRHTTLGSRPPRDRSKAGRLYRERQVLCDAFWDRALELGRWPEPDEFSEIQELAEIFGSPRRAVTSIQRFHDAKDLEASAQARREDLLITEAVALLSQRQRKVSDFPMLRQREIRSFFGSYKELLTTTMGLLRSISEPAMLNAAATACDRLECGGVWDLKGLSIERRCVDRLPTVLRCYVELGAAYHGGLEGIDLVRIHLDSGKLTLSSYDDFYGKALPLMTSRIKVDLRRQRIDDFEYGESYASPPLFWKSRFLAKDAPNLEKQQHFDKRLDELGLAPDGDPRFGFSAAVVDEILTAKGLEIRGFRFYKLK